MSEQEILKSITFYGFSFLILIFTVLTIFANRILYSLLYAVIAFFCAGGIFFSLGADYNAVVQIAIYGVAIPVIFLFAIMFTSKQENKVVYISFKPRFFISFISIALLFIVIWYLVNLSIHLNPNVANLFTFKLSGFNNFNSFIAIAKGLYVDYALALLLLGITIIISVLGISVLNVIKEKRSVR